MRNPNTLRDFDPAKFTLMGFCAECGYSAPVNRVDEDMAIPTLIRLLSCSRCGSQACSIRIIYTAVGGYSYGY